MLVSIDTHEVPSVAGWTGAQMDTIIILERTGGCISLIAVALIFLAYWVTPEVRNVQNTFIVFASVSNVGASVASVIAMDGLGLGVRSGLCQAQSFMFEMFMQSDPWWSLAMAINVFLVFYFHTSPDSFSHWWWLYCLVCYGGPFVIALSLLLVRDPDRPLVYGEATIWCWVSREWDDIRIYTYYMLIWICIIGSIILYSLVGYHVFQSRNQVLSFSTLSKSRGETLHTEDGQRINLPRAPEEVFYGTVITEVQVIHSTASSSSLPSDPRKAHLGPTVSFEDEHLNPGLPRDTSPTSPGTAQYFSSVTATATSTGPSDRANSSSRRRRRNHHHHSRGDQGAGFLNSRLRHVLGKFVVADPIKRAYLRTSFLFGLSVLATWIPSSLNRIHSWVVGYSPYGFHVATAAVLPLQGLWNAAIFFVTSSAPLKRRWRHWRGMGEEYRRGSCGEGEIRGINDDGVGYGSGGMSRRDMQRDDDGLDEGSELEDGGTMGSDVELRMLMLAETPAKYSPSLPSLS